MTVVNGEKFHRRLAATESLEPAHSRAEIQWRSGSSPFQDGNRGKPSIKSER